MNLKPAALVAPGETLVAVLPHTGSAGFLTRRREVNEVVANVSIFSSRDTRREFVRLDMVPVAPARRSIHNIPTFADVEVV